MRRFAAIPGLRSRGRLPPPSEEPGLPTEAAMPLGPRRATRLRQVEGRALRTDHPGADLQTEWPRQDQPPSLPSVPPNHPMQERTPANPAMRAYPPPASGPGNKLHCARPRSRTVPAARARSRREWARSGAVVPSSESGAGVWRRGGRRSPGDACPEGWRMAHSHNPARRRKGPRRQDRPARVRGGARGCLGASQPGRAGARSIGFQARTCKGEPRRAAPSLSVIPVAVR